MESNRKEKIRGCILGGAIGDALGAPIEFLNYNEIIQEYGEFGVSDYVEFSDGSGEFTDDTQMTLFTTEGILRAYHRAVLKGIGGYTLKTTFDSYLRWLITQGYSAKVKLDNELVNGWLVDRKELYKQRSPGHTCLDSLINSVPGSMEKPLNNSKGCGGVMRVAPVGLVFTSDVEYSFKVACEIASLTHGHPSGYLSAGVFASIISSLMSDVPLRESIIFSLDILKKYDRHEETLSIVELAVNLADENINKNLKHSEIANLIERIGAGWTGEEALAISLFCAIIFQDNYESGVLASINHSGDSDSTGAITGNILGLINGSDKIPQKWIENLRFIDIIEEISDDLYIGCKSSTYNCNEDWWKKYPGY